MVRAEQVLPAVFDPLHRPAELSCRAGDQVVLGIELAAHAEAAADIGLQHVDAFLGKVHALRQEAARGERRLGRARDRELGSRLVPVGQQASGFDGHRGVPLHAEGFPPHVGRDCHRRGRVALGRSIGNRDVGALFFEQERVVPAGRMPVRNRGQRLDVGLDDIGRVLGERDAVGHDDRDRLSHVTDLAVGDDRLLERLELRQRREPHRNGGNGAVPRMRDILGDEDAANARHGARGTDVVDRADAPVRHRAAQDRRVKHALTLQIVHESPAAPEKTQVFDAFHRGADEPGDERFFLVHALPPCPVFFRGCSWVA